MAFPSGRGASGVAAPNFEGRQYQWDLPSFDPAEAATITGLHVIGDGPDATVMLADGQSLVSLPQQLPHGLWMDEKSFDETGRYVIDELHAGTPRPMQPGRCANFDGFDDYVDLSAYTVFNFTTQQAFTLSAWFVASTADNDAMLMGKKDTSSLQAEGYALRVFSINGQVGLYIGDGTNSCNAVSGDVLLDNQWNHAVGVYDGAGNATIYVNGVLAATASTPAMAAVATPFDNLPLMLGCMKSGASIYHVLTGKMFDARIYNRALTASEVSAIYSSSRPGGRPELALFPEHLLAHWKLDAGINSGSGFGPGIVFDSSGNGYHGAVMNHSASFYHTGSDVPFSWENECGYTTAAASLYPQWTNLIPNFSSSSWTAAGTDGKAVALTNQSWAGRTGLRAAKFLHTALGTYSDNRVVTGQLGITIPANKGVVCEMDIALSRPLAAGEKIKVYFVGSVTGSPIDLESTSSVGTKFVRLVGSIVSRTPAYTDSLFAIAPVAGVTGGDITIYIDNVRYYDTNIDVVDGAALDGQRWSEVIPADSSDLTKDILGNPLQFSGPVPRNAQLVESHCGTFDGIDDRGLTANGALDFDKTQPMTVFGRIRRTASAQQFFITTSLGTGTWRGWGVGTRFGALNQDKLQFDLISTVNTDHLQVYTTENAFRLNTWHSFAVTYDGSGVAAGVKLYVDGVEYPASIGFNILSGTTLTGGAARISGNLGNGNNFTGQMNDLRVYSSVLTAADIAALNDGKNIDAQPLAHYPIAEGDGTVLHDVSGNGKHATLSGATMSSFWGTRQGIVHRNIRRGFRVPNATGTSRTFNGTSQYFWTSDNASLSVGDINCAFVALVTPASIGSTQYALAKYDATGDKREYGLTVTTDGRAQLQVSTTGTSGTVVPVATSAGSVVAGKTYLIVGYHDANANKVAVSINGGAFVEQAHAGGIADLDSPFAIGCNLGSVGANFFGGSVGLAAVLKPTGTPNWLSIRDAIYNGGIPLTYDQLTAEQKAAWGIVAWYDCDEYERTLRDKHGSNHLTGVGIPLIPARPDGKAADGNTLTNPPVHGHNRAETKIDFTGEVATSPWTSRVRDGYYSVANDGLSILTPTQQITGDFTMFSRVRPTFKSGGLTQYLFDAAWSGGRLLLQLQDATGNVSYFNGTSTISFGTLLFGQWNEVIFQWKSNRLGCWINGAFTKWIDVAAHALNTATAARCGSLNSGGATGSILGDIERFFIVKSAPERDTLLAESPLLDIYFDEAVLRDASPNRYALTVPGTWALKTGSVPNAYAFGEALPHLWSKVVDGNGEQRFACPAEISS